MTGPNEKKPRVKTARLFFALFSLMLALVLALAAKRPLHGW
jgi:hypothetical protein